MNALFPTPRRGSRRGFRPSLECLESRDCPSTLGNDEVNLPPNITLELQMLQQNQVRLSGRVTDETPAGLTVNFTGVYAGSCLTGSDGRFSFTTPVSSIGSIFGATVDPVGARSNIAKVNVKSSAPVIVAFQAELQEDNVWVISGRVSDESPAGLTVYLNGLGIINNVAVTVRADGTFSYTVSIPADTHGVITAQTTDWFGLNSAIAETYV
jgi:hypothetical protein